MSKKEGTPWSSYGVTNSNILCFLFFLLPVQLSHAANNTSIENKGGLLLQKSSEKTYFQSLESITQKTAMQLREINHAGRVDISLYGKMPAQNVERNKLQGTSINNVLFINRYLTEVLEKKIVLSDQDFSNLNIIFAASTQSYRDLFSKKFAELIRLNYRSWILSFRTEPGWVEFKLFPLMLEVGGGDIVREIIWLSTYHQDFKIRAVAENTLDELAAKARL